MTADCNLRWLTVAEKHKPELKTVN